MAVYREAAAVDSAIAEDWRELHTLRHSAFASLLAPIPDADLRLPRSDAVDTAWAIASPEMYDLVVNTLGLHPGTVRGLAGRHVRAALLN